MVTETVEGESREVAVIEPREMLDESRTPEGTVSLATRMATALRDIVEKQKLYAVIQGKKFPQVEAWMTIARMDNVVAREVLGGIVRFDDGAYEATVELIRLSDGMVIGRGSALCGSKGDRPWDSRAEPARRSMAVTRATSRAFRQQYSWIMALAGYEPTPAEEMPRDEPRTVSQPEVMEAVESVDGGLIGTAEVGKKGVADFELRTEPDGGAVVSFRLKQGRTGFQVLVKGPLANALHLIRDEVIGKRVIVWGSIVDEAFAKGDQTITYKVIHMNRIQTPDFTLPAPDAPEPQTAPGKDDDLSDMPADWLPDDMHPGAK